MRLDPNFALAHVAMKGGDQAAAIEHLRATLEVPWTNTAALLRLDPLWDPLRGNPGFQALLK